MPKSAPSSTSHGALPQDHLYRLVLTEARSAIDAAGRRTALVLTAATAAQRAFATSPDDFAALLREHGITQARRGANALLPLIHLLFGARRAPRTKSRYARVLECVQSLSVSDIGAFLRRAGGIDAVLRRRGAGESLAYPALALAIAHQIEMQQALADDRASVAAFDPDAPFAFAQIAAAQPAIMDPLAFGATIDDADDAAIDDAGAVFLATSDHAIAITGQPGGGDAIDFGSLG